MLLGEGKQAHNNQSHYDTAGYEVLHHGCHSTVVGRPNLAERKRLGSCLCAFRNLRDGGAAAAGGGLYRAPGRASREHVGDAGIAFGVLWTTLVTALQLGRRRRLIVAVSSFVSPIAVAKLALAYRDE
jgi:hypothetical protein